MGLLAITEEAIKAKRLIRVLICIISEVLLWWEEQQVPVIPASTMLVS